MNVAYQVFGDGPVDQKPIRHTRRGLADGQPGLPALARRLAVGYKVAMAATMGCMLVMMLVTGS